MKIYLATWLVDRSVGTTLTKLGAMKRLLSFFFIKDQEIPQEGFTEYCETGEFDPRKKK
jgi:hypothetical protein